MINVYLETNNISSEDINNMTKEMSSKGKSF